MSEAAKQLERIADNLEGLRSDLRMFGRLMFAAQSFANRGDGVGQALVLATIADEELVRSDDELRAKAEHYLDVERPAALAREKAELEAQAKRKQERQERKAEKKARRNGKKVVPISGDQDGDGV